jgi:hypothetical protein
MNFDSSLTYVLLIVGVIALVTILVALFYKPGKRLKVDARYITKNNEDPPGSIEFHIVSIGTKRVKMATPFVMFYNPQHSILYEVRREYTSCKFPKILEPGNEMRCMFDLAHFHDVLGKQHFKPQHVRIVIRDTVGLRFNSNPLDYHL